MPECAKDIVIKDAADVEGVSGEVDFVFSAVDMKADEIRALEEEYAKSETPVVSNNSANRWTPDVPMVIPEINPGHLEIIPAQKKRLGTSRGFIAVKSNCSIQSYVPALSPLKDEFGLNRILVCTYQAISGAGKTFETWPDMVDNVIPYIAARRRSPSRSPSRSGAAWRGDHIENAARPGITAQCLRVAASNGHMAAVFCSFDKTPSMDEMKAAWASFKGRPQELGLPSAPKQFLRYFEEPDRPQTRLDRMAEGGMQISIGRLRPDTQYDYKFVCPEPQHAARRGRRRGRAGGAADGRELHHPQVKNIK